MPFALCTPNDEWASATQVGVLSLDGSFSNRTIPVEHRAEGPHTIQRSQYANGLLLIPNGHDPVAIPAVLPVVTSGGSSQVLTLEPSNLMDMGYGGAVIFV